MQPFTSPAFPTLSYGCLWHLHSRHANLRRSISLNPRPGIQADDTAQKHQKSLPDVRALDLEYSKCLFLEPVVLTVLLLKTGLVLFSSPVAIK